MAIGWPSDFVVGDWVSDWRHDGVVHLGVR